MSDGVPVLVTFLVPQGELNEDEWRPEVIAGAERWRSSSRSEPWFFVKERGRMHVSDQGDFYVTWESDGLDVSLGHILGGDRFISIERYGLGGSFGV